MSGSEHSPLEGADGPSPEYPDLRRGTRGEPAGRMLPSENELESAAERAVRDRQVAPKAPWWKRMFAGWVSDRP